MKHIKKLILEEGGDGGGAVASSGNVQSSATGSDGGGGMQSSGGGVAYVNQGNISGMGAVKNAQPGQHPGQTGEAGSGDRSFSLPATVYTKGTGYTGNKMVKMGNITQSKPKKKEKEMYNKKTTKSKYSKHDELPQRDFMDFTTFKKHKI